MENYESSNRNLREENSVEKNKLRASKNAGRSNGALIAGLIGLVILIVVVIVGYNMNKKDHERQVAMMEDQRTMFTKQLTERDSTINDWLMTFDQIEKDLNMIKQKENILTMKSSESELSKDKKEQVLADIKYINTLLENNKKKLASLTAQLKNSNGTIKGLEARVATLETTIKQYEVDMTALKETVTKKDQEIGQLNVKVAELDGTVLKQDETIKGQTDKLNEAYLISGTSKELKEKGIITKEGGFLGLGKLGTLVADLPANSFSKIDITQLKTIPIHSKDAKLITKHPSGSYEIVNEGDKKIAYIEIKDPEMFWKISKYAVVEIGK
jgi:chromosome segregation ATPase